MFSPHQQWRVLQLISTFFASHLYTSNVHHMAHWTLWRTELFIRTYIYKRIKRKKAIHYCTEGFCSLSRTQRVRWHSFCWWPSASISERKREHELFLYIYICAHVTYKKVRVFLLIEQCERTNEKVQMRTCCVFN